MHIFRMFIGVKKLETPDISSNFTFQLQTNFVTYQSDELRIGGLALGVRHCVAEVALEGITLFLQLF